jgi:PAS domain S-box-containing protein
LAALISAGLAWYALRRREQAQALIFGLMMVTLTCWSLFYALSISGANLDTQLLFNRLKYVGVMFTPPLWLILALQYAHRESLLQRRRNLLLIFLPGTLLLLVVLTDGWTDLWWPEKWFDQFNGYPALGRTHSWIYYISIVANYSYVLGGLGLYVLFYRRTQSLYRSQAALMVVAALLPLAGSVATEMGVSPIPWGMEVFIFALSGALMAASIFRYRFLDIMPVARQMIVEQMPDGVAVVDAQGRVVDANPVISTLLALPEQPLVGQSLVDSIPTSPLRAELTDLLSSGGRSPQTRDVPHPQPAGERVLSLHVTPLVRGTSQPLGHIVILRDITDRIRVQRELEQLYQQAEESRERLALTISTASDAIVLLDASGQVLASNPSARQTLQAEHCDSFPPSLQTLLEQAQTATGITNAEIEIGEQSFHVAAAPVTGTGLVFTMHDVTHFKQLAHLKDEFVAVVSHDLRSPLTSIIGYAQIARQDDVSESEQGDALGRIETAAQRMSDLVGALLDLATLEADVESETLPVALDKLAREAIEDLEGAALSKGLSIQSDLNPHPPIQADPRLIEQMWRNLIDNAIKYTPAGTITVRVRAEDNQVLGQVSDTGVGIPPADLPYVFDKFFRADQAARTEISGTGLGLSLVKSIIEKHYGQIWVESELGVGTTFIFSFPLEAD